MSFKNLVISVILAILFTWFALANSMSVTVSIFLWKLTLSLSLIILICILFGVIISGLIAAGESARMYGKIRDLEGKLKHDEDLLGKNAEPKK